MNLLSPKVGTLLEEGYQAAPLNRKDPHRPSVQLIPVVPNRKSVGSITITRSLSMGGLVIIPIP
jgi:hypothetical protein